MNNLTEKIIAEIIPVAVEGVPGAELYGREVLLIRRERKPSQRWLDEQVDRRVKPLADSPWWGAMPFTGGYILVPEPLLRYKRIPTYKDLMVIIDHANKDARKTVAQLFPDLVEAVLKKQND